MPVSMTLLGWFLARLAVLRMLEDNPQFRDAPGKKLETRLREKIVAGPPSNLHDQ